MSKSEFIQGISPSISVVDAPLLQPSPKYNSAQAPILDVLRFAANPDNTIEPNDNLLICSDDRWWETRGGIPMFGGSAGLVLGLLAINKQARLGLSVEQMVDGVVNASPGIFHFHSDKTTEDPESPGYGIGCAHLRHAMMPANAEKYGVNPEDTIQAVSYMRKLAHTNPGKVQMGIAGDEHGAKAILINTGRRKLNHRDAERQYYVIAKTRGDDYLERFYQKLLKEFPQLAERGIGLEEFKQKLETQKDVTALSLAAGLPIFEINADDPTLPKVKKAGFVR